MGKNRININPKSISSLGQAHKANKFISVAKEIRSRDQGRSVSEIRAKRDRLWSQLSHQVVGSEHIKE